MASNAGDGLFPVQWVDMLQARQGLVVLDIVCVHREHGHVLARAQRVHHHQQHVRVVDHLSVERPLAVIERPVQFAVQVRVFQLVEVHLSVAGRRPCSVDKHQLLKVPLQST